jgi:DNA-binding FadR family transcriptional regulator
MSISSLASNLIADLSQQYQQNPFQKIQQDFKQLASALKSGDLSGAQSAYASIEQLLPANQSSSSSATGSNGSNAIQSDFASLGQALQSGDLSEAQSAFGQLQSDLKTATQSAQTPLQGEDQYVGSTSQQGLSVAQQVQQDYAQLASSLQSGDLAGAQSAFANLQQALQSQGTSTTQSTTESGTSSSSGSDTIANDFSALGQALSSGNLSQAQSAFSQLQTDIQSTQQAEASQSQSFIQQMLTLLQEQQSSTSTTGSTNSSTTSNSNSTVNIYA